MPELNFHIESAFSVLFAATPMIAFKLRVENSVAGEAIHTIVLRVQIQIEATRRRYDESEKEKLLDLFGEPDRWSRTLRSQLWTHANVVIPGFTDRATADLQVPCTFDFNVAATKYFSGLSDGEIPLTMLFSGTVFYSHPDGSLQVGPVSWNCEARFRLPVSVWRQMMDEYYPNSAWLSLRRDAFERLYEFKVRNGIPTWEQALERLLAAQQETIPR